MSATQPDSQAIAASHHDAPAAGEDIHLPGGTPLPLLITVGVTLILIGTTLDWIWLLAGAVVFTVALTMWVRDAIAEFRHLPDEHGSPAHH